MTTGQPIKIPADRNKYDNEFMENLRLQIKINDANLQANRLYQNTGQLPPSVQMADTRTTAEKLADIEGLKRSIVADLKPVAETTFAYAIIEGVIKSPLNVDNSLFRYLAQNAQVLAQQLSKKYKFGIAGDANDVAIIVNFLEDAYNKTNNTFQSIKNYMNSNTSTSSVSKGSYLSANNTDNVIAELRDIEKRIDYNMRKSIEPGGNNTIAPILRPIFDLISRVLNFLPTSEQLDRMIKNVNTLPATQQTNIFYRVLDILKTLPRPASLQTLVDKMEKGISKNDIQYITQARNNFIQLWAQIMDPTNQAILQQFRRRFIDEANYELREEARINQVNTMQSIYADRAQRDMDKKAERVYIINPGDDPANVRNVDGGLAPPVPGGQAPIVPVGGPMGPIPGPPPPVGQMNQQQWVQYIDTHVVQLNNVQLDALYRIIPNNQNLRNLQPLMNRFNDPNATRQEKEDACRMALHVNFGNINYVPFANPQVNPLLAQPILGLGIKKKKGRGLSSDYRDFGINKINHKKLDDGILTLRRQSNSNIPDMPSKRISRKLQKIIKHISGGGMPDFNDVNNLDDSEKDYLHKLISKSNLTDRLSVPAPSKDQEEKDFHQFEVMKGEIMSGNDSKELVKKFKILILKLSKQNVLPKNEVQEILEDLLSLGY